MRLLSTHPHADENTATVFLYSPRIFLWTTKLHLTVHQHEAK